MKNTLIEAQLLFWNGLYYSALGWMTLAQRMSVELWKHKT